MNEMQAAGLVIVLAGIAFVVTGITYQLKRIADVLLAIHTRAKERDRM